MKRYIFAANWTRSVPVGPLVRAGILAISVLAITIVVHAQRSENDVLRSRKDVIALFNAGRWEDGKTALLRSIGNGQDRDIEYTEELVGICFDYYNRRDRSTAVRVGAMAVDSTPKMPPASALREIHQKLLCDLSLVCDVVLEDSGQALAYLNAAAAFDETPEGQKKSSVEKSQMAQRKSMLEARVAEQKHRERKKL